MLLFRKCKNCPEGVFGFFGWTIIALKQYFAKFVLCTPIWQRYPIEFVWNWMKLIDFYWFWHDSDRWTILALQKRDSGQPQLKWKFDQIYKQTHETKWHLFVRCIFIDFALIWYAFSINFTHDAWFWRILNEFGVHFHWFWCILNGFDRIRVECKSNFRFWRL